MILKNINDHIEKNVCTHVILNDNIDDRFRKLFIKFHAFIDLDVSDKVFIDRNFALSLNLKLISLKNLKTFEIFDESIAACGFITHYVDIYFKVFATQEDARFIRFYVIELFY